MMSEFLPVKRGPGRPPKIAREGENEDLPVVDAVGWVKQPRGWVVVHIQTQGDKVVNREVLSEPSSMASAWERMRVSVITRLWQKASKR